MPDGPGCFRQGFTCPDVLRIPLDSASISPTGFAPSATELSISFGYLCFISYRGPTTPSLRTVWAPPISLATTLGITALFSSPPGTKMFQFPGLYSLKLCIGFRMLHLFECNGFPHSDSHGSLPVYDSPWRFAVFCVLLLLCMPRHPPYALLHLITLAFLENYFLTVIFLDLVYLFHNFLEKPICFSSLFVIQFSKNDL